MNTRHHITAPEDRVPFFRKVGYGTGMLGYALMIQVYMQFYNPIFNDTLGLSPVLIGWAIAIARIWDAVTDPLMGSLSDNTRSRWGRRRPWIVLSLPFDDMALRAEFVREGPDLLIEAEAHHLWKLLEVLLQTGLDVELAKVGLAGAL